LGDRTAAAIPSRLKHTSDPRQVSLLPPDAASILHLVRENLRLLAQLTSTYEIGRADAPDQRWQVQSPADLAAYLGTELSDLAQEQVRVVLLDSKNYVVGTCLLYQGGVNQTVVRLADCFREAVRAGAPAIVLLHNHPSGDPTASPEDVRLTQDASKAGDFLGIEVLDHVIVGRQGYVSLRERGLYEPGPPKSG
jgi:DNA repair protein RadC